MSLNTGDHSDWSMQVQESHHRQQNELSCCRSWASTVMRRNNEWMHGLDSKGLEMLGSDADTMKNLYKRTFSLGSILSSCMENSIMGFRSTAKMGVAVHRLKISCHTLLYMFDGRIGLGVAVTYHLKMALNSVDILQWSTVGSDCQPLYDVMEICSVFTKEVIIHFKIRFHIVTLSSKHKSDWHLIFKYSLLLHRVNRHWWCFNKNPVYFTNERYNFVIDCHIKDW